MHFSKELNPKGRLVSDQWFIIKNVKHKISAVNVCMKFVSDLYIYISILINTNKATTSVMSMSHHWGALLSCSEVA